MHLTQNEADKDDFRRAHPNLGPAERGRWERRRRVLDDVCERERERHQRIGRGACCSLFLLSGWVWAGLVGFLIFAIAAAFGTQPYDLQHLCTTTARRVIWGFALQEDAWSPQQILAPYSKEKL